MKKEGGAKLTLYGDFGSQPSRAVYCFLKINKVPFEFKEIKVIKAEQYTPEFKKVNPMAKVPAISDYREDGSVVNLFESHAIMKYIHTTRNLPDHWYPRTDPRKRAKVDEYLDWHHTNLRLGAGGYLFRKYIIQFVGKKSP